MATIRIPEQIYTSTYHHLFDTPSEHFAFFLARWTYSNDEPVFLVHDVMLIADEFISLDQDGFSLSVEGILQAVNAAVKSGGCLIEAHNHGGRKPRFSWTDREGFKDFPRYVLDSLPGRPYAATVWGNDSVYGEYFLPDGSTGTISSVLVIGNTLRQTVSRDDDDQPVEERFNRQLAWFSEQGQRELGRLRIGIVGCGGTGSHVAQSLAYLGVRDYVLVDNDRADDTSMNRLVTASAADIDTPKAILGRRLIKSVAPAAQVRALVAALQSSAALDLLKGVDVVFGCVDNDGARQILNELAVGYNIPYLDIACGLHPADGKLVEAGGQVAIVLPGGPCLHCMGQIDQDEAAFDLATPQERADKIARGYVRGINVHAPSVVAINGLVATIAINELSVLVSGIRAVNVFTEYDLLGVGRLTKGQFVAPTKVTKKADCVVCSLAGRGDEMSLQRYIANAS